MTTVRINRNMNGQRAVQGPVSASLGKRSPTSMPRDTHASEIGFILNRGFHAPGVEKIEANVWVTDDKDRAFIMHVPAETLEAIVTAYGELKK